jgi:hypothetical protein
VYPDDEPLRVETSLAFRRQVILGYNGILLLNGKCITTNVNECENF